MCTADAVVKGLEMLSGVVVKDEHPSVERLQALPNLKPFDEMFNRCKAVFWTSLKPLQ